MLVSLCGVFFITFVIFPGVFVSSQLSFAPSFSWNLIFILFGFNVFDTIGRSLAGNFHLSEKTIAGLTILRIAFIPITIFINYYDKDIHDAFKVTNIVVFAISNGYVST